MRPERVLVAIILLIGIVVALVRLNSLDVPFTDVLLTGAVFFLSLALLFLLLIGAGKIIQWLFQTKSVD